MAARPHRRKKKEPTQHTPKIREKKDKGNHPQGKKKPGSMTNKKTGHRRLGNPVREAKKEKKMGVKRKQLETVFRGALIRSFGMDLRGGAAKRSVNSDWRPPQANGIREKEEEHVEDKTNPHRG